MTDGLAVMAEHWTVPVEVAAPWLPAEAGHDGELTWAVPSAQDPGGRVQRCGEDSLDTLVEERVGMSRAASGGHGRTCGRKVRAA